MTEVSVYVFGSESGLVKVGVSKDTRARAAQLRLQMPEGRMLYERPSDAPRSWKAERLAHELLSSHRIGGEWFAVDAETAIMAVDGAIDAAVPPRPKASRGRPSLPMTWPKIGRIVMGWTLNDLSVRSGVSRHTIARLEAGGDDVTCGTVSKVLDAFLAAGCLLKQTIPGIISRGIVMQSPPGNPVPAEWAFALSYHPSMDVAPSGTARAKPKRQSGGAGVRRETKGDAE